MDISLGPDLRLVGLVQSLVHRSVSKTQFLGPDHRLGAILDAQFCVYTGGVPFHRADLQTELQGDIPISKPGANFSQDLGFPVIERIQLQGQGCRFGLFSPSNTGQQTSGSLAMRCSCGPGETARNGRVAG